MVEFIKIKKENFLNLFLFCNPFLMFLNQNLTRFDIDKSFILFQLAIIFLLAILIISLTLYLITKKFLNYSFYNFFTYLLVINFFLFFHNDLKLLLPNGRLSSEYALIILIFLSFIFLVNLSKKNIINNLLFFFVLINFFYFSINIIFKIQRDSFKESNLVSKINYEISNQGKEQNIYLIINDEATSLELLEKYYGNFDKEKIIKKFQEYGYEYVKYSKSSYNQTELTFTGMLYLDYFLDENSEKYRNIKKFYPQNLKYDYQQIPLIKLLDEINYKFYFIGNTRGNCETYIKKNCLIKSRNFKNFFQGHKIIFEVFLIRSPYIAIFNKIEEKIRRFLKIPLYNNNYSENDAIYKFIENIDKKNYPKKSFFLIHNLYPHSPYVYNKDCSQKKSVNEIISTLNTNKVDTNKGYYDNYICSIKRTFEFIKYLEENDKDAAVIFQGDHGKYFTKDNKNEKLEIFNLVKKSNNCSNKISNEIDNINAVRYLLDCATNIKIKLLEKKTFWGPYLQNDKNWGKLTKIN